jgi:uncharacterized protein YbaP (TraB family)
MKKIIAFLLLSAIIPGAMAQQKAPKPAETENALLWEVSGKGLATPSFVYGTIHVICKEDFLFSATLKEKFTNARNVYLELDMDDPGMMMKMASAMMMKDKTLKDLMSAEDYDFLSAYVKDSLGMPMMLFNRMKPITLISLLTTRNLPCAAPESYEQTMVNMAKQQNKDLKGLETIEAQLGVFDKIPDSLEVKMILDMIRKKPEQKDQFQNMVNAYKNEDLQRLAKEMSESPELKGFEEYLLGNRNRNWIPVMESAMKEGSCLFAVGAGHLPGKDGVITLLRQAGYTVRPVKQVFGEMAFAPGLRF